MFHPLFSRTFTLICSVLTIASLDCNFAEITPTGDLPGQFGACAQQCETSLLEIFLRAKIAKIVPLH